MFGSAILDVAVGMVFVYLLSSLIVTAINELIETAIKLRASHLAKGISKLLEDPKKVEAFFDQPLVKGLSPNSWFAKQPRKPSYLPSRTFAATLLQLIAPAATDRQRTITDVRAGIAALPDGQLKKALTVLLQEGEHKLEKFEEQIEVWFNSQMERVSGWYKRKVQVVTLAVALVLTLGMNLDSILLFKTLSNDSALRASLVAQAQELAKQPAAGAGKAAPAGEGASPAQDPIANLDKRIRKVEGLGLPVGWIPRPDAGPPGADAGDDDLRQWPGWSLTDGGVRQKWGKALWAHSLGWLLTAFAISLGAPFWFDMLNKIVTIRSAGKAPEEAPKPPKEEPKPLGPGETPEEHRAAADARAVELVARLAPALLAAVKQPAAEKPDAPRA